MYFLNPSKNFLVKTKLISKLFLRIIIFKSFSIFLVQIGSFNKNLSKTNIQTSFYVKVFVYFKINIFFFLYIQQKSIKLKLIRSFWNSFIKFDLFLGYDFWNGTLFIKGLKVNFCIKNLIVDSFSYPFRAFVSIFLESLSENQIFLVPPLSNFQKKLSQKSSNKTLISKLYKFIYDWPLNCIRDCSTITQCNRGRDFAVFVSWLYIVLKNITNFNTRRDIGNRSLKIHILALLIL